MLNGWRSEGCFDDVELSLGYRLQLVDADITSLTAPGNPFFVTVNLINNGFSGFYNPRTVSFVLQSEAATYVLTTDIDPRAWPLGETFSLSIEAGLPEDMEEGAYTLYLSLPDKSETLSGRPEYSVRFANENVWEPQEGHNKLVEGISINTDVESQGYDGDSFFQRK